MQEDSELLQFYKYRVTLSIAIFFIKKKENRDIEHIVVFNFYF